MAKEKCGLLAVPPTLPGSREVLPYTAHVRPSVYSRVKRTHTATAHVVLGTLRATMTSVRVFI